jgi:signal transduction histidine kinase
MPPTAAHLPTTAGARVLVVEDEVVIAAALAARLERLGYQVVGEARGEADALELALEHRPELVLMDVRLRGRDDGIRAASAIRDHLQVPVVFTTAYTDVDTLARAKDTAPHGYLVKPYDEASLRVAVELALHRAAAERERDRMRAEHARLEEKLRQSQKLEAVGRLSSAVAHDFNNLLAVIGSAAELGELAPERVPDLLDTIQLTVDRGAALTRRLGSFARVREARPRTLDLAQALDGLRGLLPRLLGGAIQVEMDLPQGALPVRIDPVHVDQILLNLAANARDAMADGGIFRIAARHAADRVELRVSDTGTGIPEAVLPRIFDPFFTTKAEGVGTGLGLATVGELVELADGTIEVDSAPGEGTRFVLSWPVAGPVAVPAPASSRPSGLAAVGTVLLVDDDPWLRDLVGRHLALGGHRVLRAEGLGRAVLAVEEEPVDVALVDVQLPGIGGVEVAATLRRLRRGLRVGFMTGRPDPSALPEGAPVLAKPFGRADLLAFVGERLREEPG